jgi:hypothetical protein
MDTTVFGLKNLRKAAKKLLQLLLAVQPIIYFVATAITFYICSRQHSRQFSCHMFQMMCVQYRFQAMII